VITVEDVLSVGTMDFLPVIGLIIDMVLMWSPRGYVYTEIESYPPGFLNPRVTALLARMPPREGH